MVDVSIVDNVVSMLNNFGEAKRLKVKGSRIKAKTLGYRFILSLTAFGALKALGVLLSFRSLIPGK